MSTESIGSYEAKTRLPELLRRVQAGQVFEISVRGHTVARLSPAPEPQQRRGAAVEKMRAFMQSQNAAGAGADVDLRALIEDGRA